MATRKRLAPAPRGAAAKKQKKEDEEDFSVFGTLDASFLEKEEGPICWNSGTDKTKKSPKRKSQSPKTKAKTPPKPKKASATKPKETKKSSPSKPKAIPSSSVWEIEEKGSTIAVEDKLGELMKGMDPSLFSGDALKDGIMQLVKFLVGEPRALPILASKSSLLSSLKDVFAQQGGSKEEKEEGDLSFWRICLLALVFRESFTTHSFYSIELLDFVFSLLDYNDSTFSASAVLEMSDSQSLSQQSQNDDPNEDSESDDEGFMLSSLTTYSKPKKEEKVEETPSKTQDRFTVMKRRQLMNTIIKDCLTSDSGALFPQTFSVVVLLELIAGGCVIRRYLRTMEFIRFLSKEICACLSYLKSYATKKDPLRTQKGKKEFQMQILRAEATLQLIEELSVWGGMEKQLTECGLAGEIVQLIGAFMIFFDSSSPQKKGNALVRSTSDLSKPRSKKVQPIQHSASSFAGLPPPSEKKKWQLLVDDAYMCDCLLGCEKTIVNLTNHSRLSSQAVGEKDCLEIVCSIVLLSMSEQKKVDAHLMAIAILLNVFESYPEARETFRSIRIKACTALTFFSRLFLENLPSQLEKEATKRRKTTTTSRIVPAYVLMLLAMACLDHSKNTQDTRRAFQTTQQGLKDLLQTTIDEVKTIFSQEGSTPAERDTQLTNLVNQLTKKLAFNY